jgi:hypothetical protein
MHIQPEIVLAQEFRADLTSLQNFACGCLVTVVGGAFGCIVQPGFDDLSY